jgi:hypothetical protein
MSRSVTLAAALVFSLASLARAQFINLTQYSNTADFSSFTKADINNDGKTDIIGVQKNPDGLPTTIITVLLATDTGFGAPINTTASGVDDAGVPIVGDFNGDGLADVAVFGKDHVTGVQAIAVMLGNGNGTFQAGKETVIGGTYTPVFTACATNVADFNGDGKLDIAYINAGINVLAGKGDGTFSAPVTSSVGSYGVSCITSGDINNDKKLDIEATTAAWVISMLGNGTGSFAAPVLVGKGGPGPIVSAQLNADTDTDLVAVIGSGTTPGVVVYLGNGAGKFPTSHTYTLATDGGFAITGPPVVRDLNGDGHADIAFIASTANLSTLVDILLNNGDGSFTQGQLYNGDGVGATGLFADDVNGDGKLDLVFGNNSGGVSALDGNGNGTFQGNLATIASGQGLNEGLFNKDANADLFLWGEPSTLLLGNGDGTFSVSTASACNFNFPVAIGNFGNGALDVAGPASYGNLDRINVCLNNGIGVFTAGGEFDQGVQHRLALAGNFAGGTTLDLAASDENGLSVLLSNGDGSFANGIPTAVDATWPNFVVADFNGDGKADIAALTSTGVAVYISNGDGTFKAPINTSLSLGYAFLAVADLNNDKKNDLIVVTGANGTNLTVLLGNGNGTFQAPVSYAMHGGALTPAVFGDFNGDGNLDLAIAVTSSVNNVDSVDVFTGSATGKLTGPTVFRAAGPIRALVTADFNNDNKPDLAFIGGDGVITMLNQ